MLNDSELKVNETLFIGDSLENIKAAEKVGVKGLHVSGSRDLFGIDLANLEENLTSLTR